MNNNEKIAVIIGAGPSGLALAYELLVSKKNIKPIIIEKLPCVGGLSRTVYFDNLGIDIGGHRLYTKDEYVKSIWDRFLTVQNSPSIDDIMANREIKYPKVGKDPNKNDDVMLIRQRHSSIIFENKFFTYPLKFNFETFSKLGFKTSFIAGCSYIKSIFVKQKENNLEDFMINRFGVVLYSIFFKDYTKKVWGVDASQLSSEWGHERIRKLSLFKTLLNSLLSGFKIFKSKKETSLIDEFFYPKYGCSQLWNLMADFIVKNGGEIIFNSEFDSFNVQDDKIISIKYKNNNEIREIFANYFISSAPICDIIKGIDAPFDVKQNALNLPYRDYILASFYTNALNLKNYTKFPTVNNITPDCWIYLQEKDAIAARIQIMNNWSPYLVGDFKNKYLVSLEYFVNETDDFYKMTDDEIINFAVNECEKYQLFKKENVIKTKIVRELKAYPSYFGTYANIDKIKNLCYHKVAKLIKYLIVGFRRYKFPHFLRYSFC